MQRGRCSLARDICVLGSSFHETDGGRLFKFSGGNAPMLTLAWLVTVNCDCPQKWEWFIDEVLCFCLLLTITVPLQTSYSFPIRLFFLTGGPSDQLIENCKCSLHRCSEKNGEIVIKYYVVGEKM